MTTLSINWSPIIANNEIHSIYNCNHQMLNLRQAIYMYVCYIRNPNDSISYRPIPLYIGRVYRSADSGTVKQRLIEHLRENDLIECLRQNCNLLIGIKIGEIVLEANQNISEELINDIECALIYNSQSTCNTNCKNSYTGRTPIQIVNLGDFSPLNHNVAF